MSEDLRRRAISELVAVAHAIKGPVMVWSNEVLVLTAAAPDAVRFHHGRGEVILGLDGFDTDGTHRIPRMDCTADFSSIDASRPDALELSAGAAFSVLAQWAPAPQFVTLVVQRLGEDA